MLYRSPLTLQEYINKCYRRIGILWEERFKSVVVENTLEALLAVSTYMDQKPIRAGVVDRVEDYRSDHSQSEIL